MGAGKAGFLQDIGPNGMAKHPDNPTLSTQHSALSTDTPLARYGVRDAAEERALRAKLRDFYERTLTEGQGSYFNLHDGALVSEIHRVLRDDGRAILAVPLKYTPQHRAVYAAIGLARAVLKPGKRGTPMPPPGTLNKALVGRQAHIRHHSLASFLDLVRGEGFAVEAVKGM